MSMLTLASNIEAVQTQEEEELLFFDNFNDGVADGWTEFCEEGGSWNIVDGEYFVTVGLVENGISTVNELDLTDCIIETKLRFGDTEVGYRTGIVFRYTDNEHYYSFEIGNEYDEIDIIKYSAQNPEYGESRVFIQPSYGNSSIFIDANVDYALKVEVHGNTFTAYLDNQEVLSWTEETYTSGKVGLRARRAHAFFDNFTVSPWNDHEIVVPDDYLTIQEAINNANEGDTVFVRNGTYYENVVVNKSISLVGENKSTTIMDGMGTGTVIHVTAINVNISEFTIQNSGGSLPDGGIHLDGSSGSSIYSNTISNNGNGVVLSSSSGNVLNQNVITQSPGFGIYLVFSQNNAINGNNVSNCGSGIELVYGSGNILRDNNMTDNGYNFGVQGISLSEFIHDIDTSNTVDGKPIYYWVNKNDKQIPSDAGFVAAVNSTKISVNGLTLTKNEFGVLFAYTTDSLIENTAVLRNLIGVHLTHSNGIIIRNNTVFRTGGINLVHSGNNIIVGNIITDNTDGITLRYDCNANEISSNTISGNYRGTLFLGFSSDNSIYHNNFIDNTNQVSLDDYSNSWDNGCEGNYWSDYNGTDLDGDGIGDTPYVIDENNTDRYPLMNPYWNPGDIDHDLDVDLLDAVRLLLAYGSKLGSENYNCHCDINEPYGDIDLFDAVLLLLNYGKKYS